MRPRVIRRVDDERAGARPNRLVERGDVEREVGSLRRHRPEHAAEVAGVGAVLDEVGSWAEHLVPGLQDGAEEGDEPTGGAARQDDVTRLDRGLLLPGDLPGEDRAHRRQAGVRAVAEPHRLHGSLGQRAEGRARCGWRRDVGVTEAEVEHIICADALLQLQPSVEHAPDPGGVLHLLPNLGRDDLHGGSILGPR